MCKNCSELNVKIFFQCKTIFWMLWWQTENNASAHLLLYHSSRHYDLAQGRSDKEWAARVVKREIQVGVAKMYSCIWVHVCMRVFTARFFFSATHSSSKMTNKEHSGYSKSYIHVFVIFYFLKIEISVSSQFYFTIFFFRGSMTESALSWWLVPDPQNYTRVKDFLAWQVAKPV